MKGLWTLNPELVVNHAQEKRHVLIFSELHQILVYCHDDPDETRNLPTAITERERNRAFHQTQQRSGWSKEQQQRGRKCCMIWAPLTHRTPFNIHVCCGNTYTCINQHLWTQNFMRSLTEKNKTKSNMQGVTRGGDSQPNQRKPDLNSN